MTACSIVYTNCVQQSDGSVAARYNVSGRELSGDCYIRMELDANALDGYCIHSMKTSLTMSLADMPAQDPYDYVRRAVARLEKARLEAKNTSNPG